MSMSLRRDWPIIVGGCHRSGTSLLRRILDAHPRVHCGPEVLFLRDFHGEHRDDPLAHLRFPATARSILPEEELLDILGGAFLQVHDRAARRAGKPRWADKAPENVLHAEDWDRLLGGEWLLVHVVRDPRDTLSSMRERPMLTTLPPDDAGRLSWYRRYVEAGTDAVERRPGRARVLLYEDLAARPREVVAELMAWADEAFDPRQLAFNDRPHQRGLEDPKVAGTAMVHRESVGRWATALDAGEADDVLRAVGDVWDRARLAAAAGGAGDTVARRGTLERSAPWRPVRWPPHGPVVIGATGGSGTRAVARIVQRAGVHLGTELSPAEDQVGVAEVYDRWLNPWLDDPGRAGDALLAELRDVLADHLRGLGVSQAWGWKEPRNLFLLPLLDRAFPGMRVIHVVRDGRDMAFSFNQNQLHKHGPLVLDQAPLTPEASMALWARVNATAADCGQRLGRRYLRIRFEDLCARPHDEARRILSFLGSSVDSEEAAGVVQPPASLGRWRAQEPAIVGRLEAIGGAQLARFGYPLAARHAPLPVWA